MKKIISLFQRNHDGDRLVRNEVVPGAEWVLAGEGVATRKFDGTCCMMRGGVLYKRYDAKAGKPPLAGFEAAQEPDPTTGHWPGWMPVGDGPEDKWHREARGAEGANPDDGTYELVGPKVQGNPEGYPQHVLIAHGENGLPDAPRDFAGIRDYLLARRIEGIVWHHQDGRMVKIKRKDFTKDKMTLCGQNMDSNEVARQLAISDQDPARVAARATLAAEAMKNPAMRAEIERIDGVCTKNTKDYDFTP